MAKSSTTPLVEHGPGLTSPVRVAEPGVVVLHEKNGPGTPDKSESQQDRVRVTGGARRREWSSVRWAVVIAAILSSTFLYALDNTVTANVRPSMIEALGNRIDMLPWLSVAYPMGEVGMNPLWGKLNKYFDNKLLYLGAVLIFEVGSTLCGAAPSMGVLICGRAIAGCGGSGIYVGTVNTISALTTERERTNYLNFVGITWCLGTILGPVVGGAFADSAATWRWAFYINLCIAAFAAPASVFLIPPISPSAAPLGSRIRRIDWVGAALFIGGVVSVIMILGSGGALYGWGSGQMIGLYVAAPAIWAVFCVQQRFSLLTLDRVFPVHFVGDREMVLFFCWGALAIANVVVTVYSLPLFFQFTYGDSSLRSAAYTIPFVGACVAVGGLAGPVVTRYPLYMAWFAGAGVLMLVGNGLLTTVNYATSRAAVCGYTIISGAGCGPIMQLGYTAAQCKVARRDRSAGALSEVTGFMSCSQMAGLALSLGIATTVFLNGATADIAAVLPGVPRAVIQATIEGAGTGLVQDLRPDVRLRVLEAIARNVAKVFYLNIAGAALGFVTALLMKRERLQLDSQAPNFRSEGREPGPAQLVV